MLDKYDVVKTTVTIAGQRRTFVELDLVQAFNAHHEFRIVINYETFGQSWMFDPQEIITLVGEEVIINMVHTLSGTRNSFFGLVTNAVICGKNGMKNNVVIVGKGRTIRLDGKKAMDSFMNKSLRGVVAEAVENSGNGAEIEINPTYQEKIDYICQYNESDFEFLNRLSYIYGEWFWDTGREIRFGRGKQQDDAPLRLIYDVNMIDFELSSKLVPAHFNRYAYLVHDDKEIKMLALDDVPNVGGYQKMVLNKSDAIYSHEGDLPVEAPITSGRDLRAMVELERIRAAAEMLTISGNSRTSQIQLGKVVHVLMPASVPLCSMGKFMVTYIEHHVNEIGAYRNTFKGIVSDMLAIPMEPIEPPRTGPQQATVLSNADPENKGRVQVQFQWQKGLRKSTNWIRVQTPDAGSSGKVKSNRGFVCIPEEGDTVMVGFDYGDPNRPYVMGSLFSEVTGNGGGQGNKGKSITTRSGHTLSFDDSEAGLGITIKDCNGNILHLDAKGKNIDITAPETVNITAKQINLNAQDISLSASNSINVSSEPGEGGGEGTIDIKAHKTMSLKTETEGISVDSQNKDISLRAKTELSAVSQSASATIQAATDVSIEGADIQVTGSSTVRVSSSDTDIV
jgi:phage-related baseplate assembly protein